MIWSVTTYTKASIRLTSVSLMSLPPGRLLSLPVHTVGEPGQSLTISFDQLRHAGAGQRPASWMAISARLPMTVDPARIALAWQAVVNRHGSLRTAFSRTPRGELELHRMQVGFGEWAEHAEGGEDELRRGVRVLFDSTCAPFEQPSHRLALVIPRADQTDQRPVVVIGSDHSHVDMWSMLVLLRDLVTALENLAQGREAGEGLTEVASFADHSAVMAARPPAPEHVHQRWAEILDAGGGVMPRFGMDIGPGNPCVESDYEVRDIFDSAQRDLFAERAEALGVRMIALAVSTLTAVSLGLSGQPLRAVFPVHSRYEPRWRDSVGWFITDSVIESNSTDPQECSRAVKEAIELGSYPLAPILAPFGGLPIAPGMFALSWLDTRRLVQLPAGSQVQYISAAVHDTGVMVWFIVNDDGLHLRARYPAMPQARTAMGVWLDAVEEGLRGWLT